MTRNLPTSEPWCEPTRELDNRQLLGLVRKARPTKDLQRAVAVARTISNLAVDVQPEPPVAPVAVTPVLDSGIPEVASDSWFSDVSEPGASERSNPVVIDAPALRATSSKLLSSRMTVPAFDGCTQPIEPGPAALVPVFERALHPAPRVVASASGPRAVVLPPVVTSGRAMIASPRYPTYPDSRSRVVAFVLGLGLAIAAAAGVAMIATL